MVVTDWNLNPYGECQHPRIPVKRKKPGIQPGGAILSPPHVWVGLGRVVDSPGNDRLPPPFDKGGRGIGSAKTSFPSRLVGISGNPTRGTPRLKPLGVIRKKVWDRRKVWDRQKVWDRRPRRSFFQRRQPRSYTGPARPERAKTSFPQSVSGNPFRERRAPARQPPRVTHVSMVTRCSMIADVV
jgi:hypothetical protein